MKIMYNCDECGGYCEGMLIQHTHYDNTKNIDDLLLVCEFCGNQLGKLFTEREFIGWTKIVDGKKILTGTTQQDLWAEKRAKIKGNK